MLFDIGLAVITMLLGVVLGLWVTRWEKSKTLAKSVDLSGNWYSVSHGGDHQLVRDSVEFERKNGNWSFRNKGNTAGYQYEGVLTSSIKNVFDGSWCSTRKGASIGGKVLLNVEPQGNCIKGVYTGCDQSGALLMLGWVMVRDESDVFRAMESLQQQLKFPKDSL